MAAENVEAKTKSLLNRLRGEILQAVEAVKMPAGEEETAENRDKVNRTRKNILFYFDFKRLSVSHARTNTLSVFV